MGISLTEGNMAPTDTKCKQRYFTGWFLFLFGILSLLWTELWASRPHNNVWKVEKCIGDSDERERGRAGIKYERRVKDGDQCKYCRHKSHCPTFLWRLVVSQSPSPHPGWGCQARHSPLKMFTPDWGRRAGCKYCRNLINTSITCNPTTALCLYSYSESTALFSPIGAQCEPRDVELLQWEVKPEPDWFTTIISFLGQLTRTLHLTLTKSNYKLQSFHKLALNFS